jgi:hypothetical protein
LKKNILIILIAVIIKTTKITAGLEAWLKQWSTCLASGKSWIQTPVLPVTNITMPNHALNLCSMSLHSFLLPTLFMMLQLKRRALHMVNKLSTTHTPSPLL